MRSVTYGIVEESYCLNGSTRVSFGIAAYATEDGTATVLVHVGDITPNKEKLSELVWKCNQFELSIIHLRDVIEDFISE